MELVAKESLRIVHVEDDGDFADLTSRFLKRAGFGHPVAHCNDGAHALDYLQMIEADRAPHVILLDLNIPRINGWEVLRWIRQWYFEPDVAVYLLTSSGDSYQLEHELGAGVTKYFPKNCSFDALIAALDQRIAIHNHRQLAAVREMKEMMAEFTLLSEFIDDMMVLADTDGRIDWVNKPGIRTCRYAMEELQGKTDGMLLREPESKKGTIEMLHDAIQSGRPIECRILNGNKGRTPYIIHLSFDPVFYNGRSHRFPPQKKVPSGGKLRVVSKSKAIIRPFQCGSTITRQL